MHTEKQLYTRAFLESEECLEHRFRAINIKMIFMKAEFLQI